MIDITDITNPLDVGHTTDTIAQRHDIDQRRDDLIELINVSGPTIVFDPIIHVQSGQQVGSEALSRLPGTLTTAEWFQLAHAIGVGDDLELRVVHDVLRLVSRHSGARFTGINASPTVVVDPRFVDAIAQYPGVNVVVEITAQTQAPTLAGLRTQIARLRELGADIAIHVSHFDDEALRCLLVAEPSMVKLDVALTTALAAGRVDSAHARNFFAKCRRDGVIIVAVGVERPEQLRVLEALGVDAYQGYITRSG